MFKEVQEEIQEKDAEQDIVDRDPQLKQLSADNKEASYPVLYASRVLQA